MTDEEVHLDRAVDREVRDGKGRPFTVSSLHDRVTLVEPGVVELRELDTGSPEALVVFGDRIVELTRDLDAYSLLVNLADATGSMTTPYRQFIPGWFRNLHAGGTLKHCAVAFFGHPVARVVSRFLVARILDVPCSVHGNREKALQAARQALR
jgi:hypothetical protein